MTLDQVLTAAEYSAVIDTVNEEIDACERLAIEDGYEPERAGLLRSAIVKIAPEAAR